MTYFSLFPHLKIRSKLLFLIFFILILMSMGIGFMAFYSQNRVRQAQLNHQQNNNYLAQNAIQTTSLLQDLLTQDYSQWDAMANAVQAEDIEWINKEFFGPLQIYQVEAVWIIKTNGDLLYTEQRDTTKPVQLNLTEMSKVALSLHEGLSFFGWSEGQLVKYKISPITSHTAEEKDTTGYLVVADTWDDTTLQSLSGLVNAKVSVSPTFSAQNLPIHVSSVSLFDHNLAPIGALHFAFQDDSLQIISEALLIQQLIVGGLGCVGLILSIFSLTKWILKPLHGLTQKLSRAVPEDQLCELEKCGNEFDTLSLMIDSHLEQTARSRRLSQAVEAATDAVIITSKDKKIVYVNPAWQQLNGYTMKEVQDKNPNLLKSSKTEKSVYTRMWQELSSGRPFTTESIINKRKDGTIYHAQISVFPIIENGEIINFVGIAQDISKRKEVERMKTEFISLASHQLRTPLSAMRWFSELLLNSKKCTTHPEQAEWIEKMHQSTLRMINMVNDLLNISRLESGRLKIVPETVTFNTLITDLLTQFEPLTNLKKITIKTEVDATLKPFKADPKLLQEVMANLLSNAVKYTPESGVVTITAFTQKDSFMIAVKDSGLGIPASEQKHLFKRFFRGSNAQDMNIEGTGLGLYLVRLIVHAWGGEIGVESQVKIGTKVWFTIPLDGMVGRPGEVDLSPSNEVDLLPDEK